MKRIDENQLANRVAGLREKMAEIQRQQVNEVDWGGMASKAWNGLTGALGTTGGKIAAGGLAGAGALAAGQAMTKPGAPAAGAKSDPAVMKQQQDLIAKGAKIKADGIMGPATQAAIKQFGGTAAAPAGATTPAAPGAPTAPTAPTAGATPAPADAAKNPVGTTNAATAIPTGGLENPANQAKAPAAAPAAAPAGAPANVTAQGSEFGTDATFAKPEATPAAGQAAAPASTTAPAAFDPTGKTPEEIQAARNRGEVDESVSFRNDELSRIVSLVQYR